MEPLETTTNKGESLPNIEAGDDFFALPKEVVYFSFGLIALLAMGVVLLASLFFKERREQNKNIPYNGTAIHLLENFPSVNTEENN